MCHVRGGHEPLCPDLAIANIVQSEHRHIEALSVLFQRYVIPPPADNWNGRMSPPDTIGEACRAAVGAELENMGLSENIDMYRRLLTQARGYPDLESVLRRLQVASRDNRLPALRRCCTRCSD